MDATPSSSKKKPSASKKAGTSGAANDTGNEIYTPERILQVRWKRSKKEYLIKWKGYDDPKDMTWEPVANLVDGMQSWLEEFDRAHAAEQELTLVKAQKEELSRALSLKQGQGGGKRMGDAEIDPGSKGKVAGAKKAKTDMVPGNTEADNCKAGGKADPQRKQVAQPVGSPIEQDILNSEDSGTEVTLALEKLGGKGQVVKVKTGPGLEADSEESDAGYPPGFADMGQGQEEHAFPLSPTTTYVRSPETCPGPQASNEFMENNKAMKLKLDEIAELKKESLKVKLWNCILKSKLKDKKTSEVDVAQLKKDLLQSKGKVASLNRELNKARSDGRAVEELKKDLFRKDGLVAQLMQDLTVVRSQVEQMGKDLSRKDAQIASVKQGLKDVEKENDRLTQSLSGTRELVQKLQMELDASRQSNEEIKGNLLKKEETVVGLHHELKLKKNELDDQMGKLTKARGEAQQFHDQNVVMHAALEQAQTQISNLTDRVLHVQKDNDTLRDNLSLQMVRMECCKKEKETLMKACKEMMPTANNNMQSQSQKLNDAVKMGELKSNLDVPKVPEPASSDLEGAPESNSNPSKSKTSEKDKAAELQRKLDAMRNSKRKLANKPNCGNIQLQCNSSNLERRSQEYAQVEAGGYRHRNVQEDGGRGSKKIRDMNNDLH